MKRARFTYRQLIALAICFTFSILLATGATSTANGHNSNSADASQDESFHIHINPKVSRDLDDFSKDLITYVKVYNDLSAKQKISQAELNALMKLEGDAKRMAPMYKTAVISAMAEIQGAGVSNSALDAHVMKLVKDSTLDAGKKAAALDVLRQAGGYTSLMAKTRDLMDRVPQMFSDAMNDLKKKVAASATFDSGLIHATYVPGRDESRLAEVALVKKTKLTLCEVCFVNFGNCQLACNGARACLDRCANAAFGCFAANGGCPEITQ